MRKAIPFLFKRRYRFLIGRKTKGDSGFLSYKEAMGRGLSEGGSETGTVLWNGETMGNVVRLSNLKKTFYYIRKNGWTAAWQAVRERVGDLRADDYAYQPPGAEEREAQRRRVWEEKTLFSVIVPAYETKEAYLEELLDSLQAQTYETWELIVADASRSGKVERVVRARQDARIRYWKLEKNGGISENTNAALAKAEGAYTGLLDHDDLLTPDALYWMADAIEKGKKCGNPPRLLYSDEDKCGEDGSVCYEPHRKTAFNADLLLSNNYICHFMVMQTKLIRTLGLRADYDGAQDFDLMLRAADALGAFARENPEKLPICHIDKILYHWRCHQASTAANPASKRYAYEAGRRALEDFCRRKGIDAAVEHTRHLGFYRLCYRGDFWQSRPDVGALAGPLPARFQNGRNRKGGRRKTLQSGIYEADGSQRYETLRTGFSGYMHRAVLQQDVVCADIRTMKVRPELEPLRNRLLARAGRPEAMGREEAVSLSRRFCEQIREEGYKICWDPMADTAGEYGYARK